MIDDANECVRVTLYEEDTGWHLLLVTKAVSELRCVLEVFTELAEGGRETTELNCQPKFRVVGGVRVILRNHAGKAKFAEGAWMESGPNARIVTWQGDSDDWQDNADRLRQMMASEGAGHQYMGGPCGSVTVEVSFCEEGVG
jgi:hypothetical protein